MQENFSLTLRHASNFFYIFTGKKTLKLQNVGMKTHFEFPFSPTQLSHPAGTWPMPPPPSSLP